MDSLCQFAQSRRLNRIFSILKLSYCALGNAGLPREKLCGVYKHVRVLRRGIDALASFTDSELLTLYPELRLAAPVSGATAVGYCRLLPLLRATA